MYMQGLISFGWISERNICPHSTDRNYVQTEKYLVNIVLLERPVLTFFLDRRVAILASRITKGEEMT
jgi:hypothetical protein